MVGRHKSSGSRPKLIPRPKHGATVLRNVGLFAGYNESSVLEQDDAFDLAEQLASHKRDDDASGAGEDAIPNRNTAEARHVDTQEVHQVADQARPPQAKQIPYPRSRPHAGQKLRFVAESRTTR